LSPELLKRLKDSLPQPPVAKGTAAGAASAGGASACSFPDIFDTRPSDIWYYF